MSNIASGIQIIFTKPFKVGDYVAIDGNEGIVQKIEIMYSSFITLDNKVIIIPNSKIASATIINYTHMENRMLDLSYDISYNDDISKAKSVLTKIAEENKMIVPSEKQIIAVGKHGNNSIQIVMKVWCKTQDYWKLYYQLQEKVKLEFDKNGLTIPYPQMDVHVDSKIT